MRTAIWSGPAIRDVAAITRFYKEIASGLAGRMVERIRASPTRLLEKPHIGPLIGIGSARKWPVRGTPFLLRYQTTPHRIEILRVHHAARDWHSQ